MRAVRRLGATLRRGALLFPREDEMSDAAGDPTIFNQGRADAFQYNPWAGDEENRAKHWEHQKAKLALELYKDDGGAMSEPFHAAERVLLDYFNEG